MQVLREIGIGRHAVYAYHFPSQVTASTWPCKIGMAVDPLQRIREQQAGMQERPEVGLIIWTDDASLVERRIHAALQHHRIDSFGTEWFDTNPEDIEHAYRDLRFDCRCLDSTEDIGAAIQRKRLIKGWTLVELYKYSGVHPSTLSNIEKGNIGSVETALKIFRVLGIELVAKERKHH